MQRSNLHPEQFASVVTDIARSQADKSVEHSPQADKLAGEIFRSCHSGQDAAEWRAGHKQDLAAEVSRSKNST